MNAASEPAADRAVARPPHQLFDAVVWTAALMFLAVLGVHEAHASDHRHNVANPAYQAECGSCHVAYPPALLPAVAWRAVLDRLDKHYGSDASLDAATARQVSDFVLSNAGRERGAAIASGVDLPRISTTRWFIKEHREEVPPSAASAARSMSNCDACHIGAARGDYAESTLRMPR